jgi:formate dehydrogenase major subunit
MASIADLHLAQNLGTDVALLNGMAHVIIENGWHDKTFVDERTEAFDEFATLMKQYDPERVSKITGIPADDIIKAAETYAKAEAASILYAMGITQHTHGVDNVKCLANLAMITGNLGKRAAGVNPLRGQNNVQGACDMGGLPNVFPAYQAVIDENNKKKFEEAWQAELSGKVGYTVMEMMHGLEDGSIKGMVILGENPMGSDPDVNHVKHSLESAEFLAVIDIFLTDTAKLAHVVLPGVSFAETDGTSSNTERRVLRVRKAVEPVGEARPDWQIIADISTRFGVPMSYDSPEDIFNELRTVTPSYKGITYERIEGGGIAWPCPDEEHPGTPILHQGRFTRGKGLFHAIEFRPPVELVDEEYPIQMTTGRYFPHYHTGTMTRNCAALDREMPEGHVEIHPEDAAAWELKDGDQVRIISRRGEVITKVRVADLVKKGTIFMSFHFMEANANVLTNPALDPICKIPEYKVCAVRVEKPAQAAEIPAQAEAH